MTICYKGYEGESDTYAGYNLSAQWTNSGLFGFSCLKRPEAGEIATKGHVSTLPTEMKQILEHGDFEGEECLRPCLVPYKGRVHAKADGDYITVVEENEFLGLKRKSTLRLLKRDWEKMYQGCIKSRDEEVEAMGWMIEPLIGVTCFQEEYEQTKGEGK